MEVKKADESSSTSHGDKTTPRFVLHLGLNR